jgi:hypothetical protein
MRNLLVLVASAFLAFSSPPFASHSDLRRFEAAALRLPWDVEPMLKKEKKINVPY